MKENKVIKINRFSIKVLALSCAIWSAALLGFAPSGLSADPPSVIGQWGDVMDWRTGATNSNPNTQSGRNVAVHLVLLPTGKLIMYPYVQHPHLWDPMGNPTNLIELPYVVHQDGDRQNIFCGAHSHTPDGRVLFTGGDVNNYGYSTQGDKGASYFNPFDPLDSPWTTNLPPMTNGRWYGTS